MSFYNSLFEKAVFFGAIRNMFDKNFEPGRIKRLLIS